MRKFTICLDKSYQVIDLSESLLNINHLYVKKATIFWEYENVSSSIFTTNHGSTKLKKGYYTFGDIANLFEKDGITLEKSKVDGKCIFNFTGSLVLSDELKNMLRFKNGIITSGSTSDIRVSMNHGLKYIKVKCNSIQSSHSINEYGKKDNILISLVMTSQQRLFGSVQTFDDIESKVPVNKGVINQLEFTVTDQDNNPIHVGSILLDLYLL